MTAISLANVTAIHDPGGSDQRRALRTLQMAPGVWMLVHQWQPDWAGYQAARAFGYALVAKGCQAQVIALRGSWAVLASTPVNKGSTAKSTAKSSRGGTQRPEAKVET